VGVKCQSGVGVLVPLERHAGTLRVPNCISPHPRDRLRGWGGETRTAESVRIKIRPFCWGISGRFGRNGLANRIIRGEPLEEFAESRDRDMEEVREKIAELKSRFDAYL
jgi:hypothetical protein